MNKKLSYTKLCYVTSPSAARIPETQCSLPVVKGGGVFLGPNKEKSAQRSTHSPWRLTSQSGTAFSTEPSLLVHGVLGIVPKAKGREGELGKPLPTRELSKKSGGDAEGRGTQPLRKTGKLPPPRGGR